MYEWEEFTFKKLHITEKYVRNFKIIVLKGILGTSLVVQWLRIHLPIQGTRV